MSEESSPLRSPTENGNLPHFHWECRERGKWIPDEKMTVTSGPKLLCASVRLSAPGAAYFPQEFLGKYTATSDFSSGRQIFKHEKRKLYLHVISGKIPWLISSVVNSENYAVVKSGTSPSMCPGDKRARYRQRKKENCVSWKYKSVSWYSWFFNYAIRCKWVEVSELIVTCDTCM